jgi:hypothetical protein
MNTIETSIELWRKVWRDGFAKVLPRDGVEALLVALDTDDHNLLQGATTCPPPLLCVRDWPCEGACVVGYTGWKSGGIETTGGVEKFFAKACFDTDNLIGEPASCRHFLNYVDDTPRDVLRRELATEIRNHLQETCDASGRDS